MPLCVDWHGCYCVLRDDAGSTGNRSAQAMEGKQVNCPICSNEIAGMLEELTKQATGGGHFGHFWCVFPNGPKERLVVPIWDFEQIEYLCGDLEDARIQHFTT